MIFPTPRHCPSDLRSSLGGKGAALLQLHELNFEIPPWFAVLPENSASEVELASAVTELGGDRFAVRSSGAMEDGAENSFAGQYDTFLDVSAEHIAAKVQEVRDSARKPAIQSYCQERGLPPPQVPTVLVQEMIQPHCAGVAFSADPVSGERSVAVVSAVRGTGEKLVSGEVDGETWRVATDVIQPGGQAILNQSDALAVANLARRCEAAFGRPQDIEWAIDGAGKLWLLQSRPITTLRNMPDPNDPLRVWDNSNIAESYGGVTTPLTFSFARRIYEHVYREFCALMSVPAARIERAEDVFPQMLGLIRGRTYYNLASWYRVLALLPGFQVNRSFMEQMMGVREPLPEQLVQSIIAESKTGKLADSIALLKTFAGLVMQLLCLKRQVIAFQKRLDLALKPVALEAMTGNQLVAHYRDLERRLLKKWDAPLVNDFFAMIFYGVLRGLCGKWAGDSDGTLQNELLADTGGIISAEPPRRIREMARMAADVSGLPELLENHNLAVREKLAALRNHFPLSQAFEAYLDRFGDRCLEELKLESPTVRDDASTLLTSIGSLAGMKALDQPSIDRSKPPSIANPIKRWIFQSILNQTRERIRCRENLRFERTRLFGRVRSIVRELGKRLHADDQIESQDDIFYLELGELLDIWEGTPTIDKLIERIRLRRKEFEEYTATEAPPDRFQTRGPIHRAATWEPTSFTDETAADSSDTIKGTGACPGTVRGIVRVVLEPRGARLEAGEILVARQTDPGWVVLFPSAAGLLVERGSLLSHSAIVSRELRLPCIVSLPGITNRLKNGDVVEMNGTTGIVRIIQP